MKYIRRIKKDKRGVSPVIAVILLVAITIVLAAVIASFVYGYASTLERQKQVSATASYIYRGTSKAIVVTYHGGPDQDEVEELTVSVYTAGGTQIVSSTTLGTTPGSQLVLTSSDIGDKGQNHVVVTAEFKDGSSQVILDTWV